MSRPAEALIDLAALRHNLQRVRHFAPHSRVMSVIKANAYGHGMIRVAKTLAEETDAFAVASLEEAWGLRMAGIKQPINLLEGIFEADELPHAVEHQLDLTIHHIWQINALLQASLSKPVKIWLKLDTGMHRLGIEPAKLDEAWEHLHKSGNVAPAIGLMSHFANADEPEDDTTTTQLTRFHSIVADYEAEHSLANSAAIVAWPQSHADWVRPGIMLYGVSPLSQGLANEHGLKPVMTLRSRLIAVQHLQKGDCVGYGGDWCCPEAMPIGVVAMGYGDGYPRHAVAGTPVLVNGKEVPLVGRVSMDMLCVDLRTQPKARVGDEVVLWGEGLAAERVAKSASTIAYELFCGVTPRVKMVEQR